MSSLLEYTVVVIGGFMLKQALKITFILWGLLPLSVSAACAQGARPSEPLKAVQNEKRIDTSPEQSRRLQKIRDLPTTESVHILRRDQNAPIGEELKISIPNDRTLLLSKTGGETSDSKDFTWYGVVKGDERGSATLIARNGEISGSINTPEGLYRISPLGDGLYAMAKVDTRKLPTEEPPRKDKNQ
jgi:hypothetical protein